MASSASNNEQVPPTPEDPEKKKKKEEKVFPLSSYPYCFTNRDLRKMCFLILSFNDLLVLLRSFFYLGGLTLSQLWIFIFLCHKFMALSQAREKQLKKEKFLLKQAQVKRVPAFPVVQLQYLI